MLANLFKSAALAAVLGLFAAPAMATVVTTLPSEGWTATALVGGTVSVGAEGATLKTGADARGRAELRLGSTYGDRMGTVTSAIANNTVFSYTVKAVSGYVPELAIAIGVSDFADLRYAFDPSHATTAGGWTTYTLDIASAKFWALSNQNRLDIVGGRENARTLADWSNEINRNAGNAGMNEANNNRFKAATINSLILTIYQQADEEAVVGAFSMSGSGTHHDGAYTFGDYAPIPLPAALPMLIAGLGVLGFAARRRKAA